MQGIDKLAPLMVAKIDKHTIIWLSSSCRPKLLMGIGQKRWPTHLKTTQNRQQSNPIHSLNLEAPLLRNLNIWQWTRRWNLKARDLSNGRTSGQEHSSLSSRSSLPTLHKWSHMHWYSTKDAWNFKQVMAVGSIIKS